MKNSLCLAWETTEVNLKKTDAAESSTIPKGSQTGPDCVPPNVGLTPEQCKTLT